MQIGELNQESATTINHKNNEKQPIDIRLSGTFTKNSRPKTGVESKTIETVDSSALGNNASRGMNFRARGGNMRSPLSVTNATSVGASADELATSHGNVNMMSKQTQKATAIKSNARKLTTKID